MKYTKVKLRANSIQQQHEETTFRKKKISLISSLTLDRLNLRLMFSFPRRMPSWWLPISSIFSCPFPFCSLSLSLSLLALQNFKLFQLASVAVSRRLFLTQLTFFSVHIFSLGWCHGHSFLLDSLLPSSIPSTFHRARQLNLQSRRLLCSVLLRAFNLHAAHEHGKVFHWISLLSSWSNVSEKSTRNFRSIATRQKKKKVSNYFDLFFAAVQYSDKLHFSIFNRLLLRFMTFLSRDHIDPVFYDPEMSIDCRAYEYF